MAAQTEQWLCQELAKLGIDSNEDSARYILSMESSNDLEEYMLEILDGTDPQVRFFLMELKDRYNSKSKGKKGVQPYRKEKASELEDKSKKKSKPGANQNNGKSNMSKKQMSNGNASSGPQKASSLQDSPNGSGEIGVGAKKKSKYVPLYSKEGQEKSVIQLSGRHRCECQAVKHSLVNNCVQCGRVVCAQEGPGPCFFCGDLVCSPEDMALLEKGNQKSDRLRRQLMQNVNGLSEVSKSLVPSHCPDPKDAQTKALQHRDKLLEYDRTSAKRTQVIDDECDYYATDSNQWLSHEDREKLRKRETELRESRHGSRRDRKITFDIAGRRVKVLDAEEDTGKTMYSRDDAVIQEVHYGKAMPNGDNTAVLINPSYDMEPPIFLDCGGPAQRKPSGRKQVPTNQANPVTSSRRIQDRELQEMSDQGMCLSMHQPWASLLVAGIKMHEGRKWYTSHRGRLWIAATVKEADHEEILQLENFYRYHYPDSRLEFPKDYPTSCLLGCVNVDDCLDQDQYREKFPDGESSSPYVFICSNPSTLLVKFPMKGQHKIYKLESHIHQAAKKGIR